MTGSLGQSQAYGNVLYRSPATFIATPRGSLSSSWIYTPCSLITERAYKAPARAQRLENPTVIKPSDKPISNSADSARLKINPDDDFLDDSSRAKTIPVERDYVSFNSSRLRANPEDVFLDDGGQIEYQQTTTTTKKTLLKDPVGSPAAKSHDLLGSISSVEHNTSSAEQPVCSYPRTRFDL